MGIDLLKFFIITAISLVAIISFAVLTKGNKEREYTEPQAFVPIEIELNKEIMPVAQAPKTSNQPDISQTPSLEIEQVQTVQPEEAIPERAISEETTSTDHILGSLDFSRLPLSSEGLPTADRVTELFSVRGTKLPIVETIVYSSKPSWQKGGSAWISDYARHYQTSRHFIARSLNGKPDYLKQDVSNGDRFNVLRLDKDLQFHLLVDLSRCKMWFYYLDKNANERVLLKTYDVCLGRPDSSRKSGILTPLGKYSLGDRVASYKPGVMGYYKSQQTEMIRVFGTRWIPFAKEIDQTTEPAKSLGIHGLPWVIEAKTGHLVEDLSSIRKYESDGCIRMSAQDMEELYAIIISKPTIVHLVRDFYDADLETGGH